MTSNPQSPHDSSLSPESLATVYAYPSTTDGAEARPWLRTNFVGTLDGAAQGPDGRTGTINTEADHVVFDTLRELADAVIVGANTIREEGYRALQLTPDRAARRASLGMPPHPPLIIVSDSLDVPDELPIDGAGPVLVVTAQSSDSARAKELVAQGVEVITLHAEGLLPELIHWCADRGWNRLLSEGGPHLHGALLQAGLVDELCLTITPVVIGGDRLRIAAGQDLAVDFTIGDCFTAQDSVFLRMVHRSS
ncbi:dihydrofolate reductase family protein [Propionibacteriaceae bacterium Y1685]|uniref:dihydrofolate reductase family protein n=1 Tax=Microlunatus sp. Y1700 TaxID=3418487 RepID=UPI003B7C689F